MTKAEVRAAAKLLRTILERVRTEELDAPGRVVARLEGALTALEAQAQRSSSRSRSR